MSEHCLYELPFGDRMLFRVRLPPTLRVRRIGRIAFFRRKYLANTPSNATPAVTEITTTYTKLNVSIIITPLQNCIDSNLLFAR